MPNYIEYKHFNDDFPENHNIRYEKSNNCYIKGPKEWTIANLNDLSHKLLRDNLNEMKMNMQ